MFPVMSSFVLIAFQPGIPSASKPADSQNVSSDGSISVVTEKSEPYGPPQRHDVADLFDEVD